MILAKWGQRGAPLLPASLRGAWEGEALPDWAAAELGLRDGSTFHDLGVEVWSATMTLTDRLRNLLIWLVHSRNEAIGDLVVIDDRWPAALDVTSVPWRNRTVNCIMKSDIGARLKDLPGIRYRHLCAVPSMGALSILDFACTLEAAIDTYTGRASAGAIEADGSVTRETDAEPLLSALNQPWVDEVSELDPRFAPLLPPGRGTLFERIDALTSTPSDTPAQMQERALSQAILLVEDKVRHLRTDSLEESLEDYLHALTGFEGQKLEALRRRFGLDGQPPVTLQKAADIIGVSRERIRQLESRITSLLPPHPVVMPALDEAISLLEQHAPTDADTFGRLVVERGLNRRPFHPRSVIAAASITGRNLAVTISRTSGRDRFIANAQKDFSSKVLSIANRQAGASGVSNVSEVSAELHAAGICEGPESVRTILKTYSNVEFLDDDWFWQPRAGIDSNRLRNVTRKMLSVASPMDVTDIREGVRRVFRYRRTRGNSGWPLVVAPRAILAGFFEAHPEFVIRDGMVESAAPLDYKRELSPAEQLMVEVLRSSPTGLLDRASFEESCIERGVTRETFSVFTSYSSVISHVSTNVWTLRGLKIDPTAVEATRHANAERPREKRTLAHGWTPAGHLWLGVRIPISGAVIAIPSTIRHLLANRDFEARQDKAPAGTIRIDEDGTSWGYGPFLRRAGADEGDVLLIDFDLVQGVATLAVTDDEELERVDPE